MSEQPTAPTFYAPSIKDRIRWKFRGAAHAAKRGADRAARWIGYAPMERRSNLVRHAEREFKAAGWDLERDEMQRLICEQVIELLRVFSAHGHSGSSAPYAIRLFTKLADFEPIVPIMGTDDEWNEVSDGIYQNNRCGHVFKDINRFGGQAYDIEAVIFRDKDGGCYTSSDSFRVVEFPYTPKREYVDR